MSDKPYLDKEAILNASELVNSTLMSKGYITEKLLFNTINWNEIRPNDGEDGEGVKERFSLNLYTIMTRIL